MHILHLSSKQINSNPLSGCSGQHLLISEEAGEIFRLLCCDWIFFKDLNKSKLSRDKLRGQLEREVTESLGSFNLERSFNKEKFIGKEERFVGGGVKTIWSSGHFKGVFEFIESWIHDEQIV